MIPQSDAYRQRVTQPWREWSAKARITLKSGETVTLGNSDIEVGGLQLDSGISDSGKFTVSSANIAELKLTLQNHNDRFSDYDFDQAEIRPSVGLKLADGTTEWVPLGVFDVDEAAAAGGTVSIVALDRMARFDRDFADSTCAFPCTLNQLLAACCLECGVQLAAPIDTNGDYTVLSKPTDCTYREVIAWIAQLSGCFARMTYNGKLALTWYDMRGLEAETDLYGGDFTSYTTGDNAFGGLFTDDSGGAEQSADGGNLADYTSGDAIDGGDLSDYSAGADLDGGSARVYEPEADAFGGFFAWGSDGAGINPGTAVYTPHALLTCSVGTDDWTITGVKITSPNDDIPPVICGTEQYAVAIEQNALVQSDPSGLAANLGQKLIGFVYRTAEITVPADPTIEPGDIMRFADRKGNVYGTIVSRISYQYGAPETLYADGESSAAKQARQQSPTARAVSMATAAAAKAQKVESLSKMLSEMIGNSLGVYQTITKLPDGSQVLYQHDQPTLAASKTIWKKTADAFAVSTDGGASWTAGLTSEGNLVVKMLEAERIQSPVDENIYIDLLRGEIGATRLTDAKNTDSYVSIGTDGYGGRGKQSEGLYLYRDNNMRAMLADQPDAAEALRHRIYLLVRGALWLQGGEATDGKVCRICLLRRSTSEGVILFEVDGQTQGYITTEGYRGPTFGLHTGTHIGGVQSDNAQAWIKFDPDGTRISFGAGGKERGSLDANGWHGAGTTNG